MILCKHSKSYKVLWGRIFIIVYHAHGKNEKISNSFRFLFEYILPTFNQN